MAQITQVKPAAKHSSNPLSVSKLNVRKDSSISIGEQVTCYIDPTLPMVKQSVNERVTIIDKGTNISVALSQGLSFFALSSHRLYIRELTCLSIKSNSLAIRGFLLTP